MLNQHTADAETAKQLYLQGRDPAVDREIWLNCFKVAQERVLRAIDDSLNLFDLERALLKTGGHMYVFRHMLAPPCSQDQFSLLSPTWRKVTEKNGAPLHAKEAADAARVLLNWFDLKAASWLAENRQAKGEELDRLVDRTAALMANQSFQTVRRNALAAQQEGAVIEILLSHHWKQLPSQDIDRRADVPSRHFMHKTRFATRTRPQEVDIALGLSGTYVAAMECKVSNDATNSVKRINDVIKKATAWKEHWGSFVEPTALLQGVIKPSDVHRLIDAGIVVFWSHRLSDLEDWLKQRLP